MNLEENNEIGHNEYWDKGVILVAFLLTLCAIGVCVFAFTLIPAKKPVQPKAAVSDEVIIAIPARQPAVPR